MAGSSQPYFFAAGRVIADFQLLEFLICNKNFIKILCMLFANMFKIVQKLGQTLNLLNFRTIFNQFATLIFALRFNI